MPYFSLRCFEPKVARYIIIGLNVILALLGVIHFGYIGIVGQFKDMYKDFFWSVYEKMYTVYDSTMAFFAITAIIQIVISVMIILLALQVLGKDRHLLWVRIAILLLMIVFGFEFFVAVYSSMNVSYWNIAFRDILEQAYSISFQLPQQQYSQGMIKLFKIVIVFVRFSYAEAILTWVLGIPCIIITLFSLVDQLITEENIKFVKVKNELPKIQPNYRSELTLTKIKEENR